MRADGVDSDGSLDEYVKHWERCRTEQSRDTRRESRLWWGQGGMAGSIASEGSSRTRAEEGGSSRGLREGEGDDQEYGYDSEDLGDYLHQAYSNMNK